MKIVLTEDQATAIAAEWSAAAAAGSTLFGQLRRESWPTGSQLYLDVVSLTPKTADAMRKAYKKATTPKASRDTARREGVI